MSTYIIEYEIKRRATETFVTTHSGLDHDGALRNFVKRRPDITPKRIARVSGVWKDIEYINEPHWRVVQ